MRHSFLIPLLTTLLVTGCEGEKKAPKRTAADGANNTTQGGDGELSVEETLVKTDGSTENKSPAPTPVVSGAPNVVSLQTVALPDGLPAGEIVGVAKNSPTEFLFYTADGSYSWKLDEATGKITKVETIFEPADAAKFTLANGDLWYLTSDTLSRSARTPASTGGTNIPGGQISLRDVFCGTGDTALPAAECDTKLAAVQFNSIADRHVIALLEGSAYVFRFRADTPEKLSASKIPIPADMTDAAANGTLLTGVAEDGESYWFFANNKLQVLQKRGIGSAATMGWVASELDVQVPEGAGLAGLAMLVTFDASYAVQLAGGTLALTQAGDAKGLGYFKADGTTPKLELAAEIKPAELPAYADIAEVTFDTHIKLISEASCMGAGCHTSIAPILDTEQAWMDNQAAIIERVSVANKDVAGVGMPVPGTPKYDAINDEQRNLIEAWFNAAAGPADPAVDPNQPVALTFAADVQPLTMNYCAIAGCHAVNNYAAEATWLGNLQGIKNRLNGVGNIMPQAGSAQAAAIQAAERALMIQYIDQELAKAAAAN